VAAFRRPDAALVAPSDQLSKHGLGALCYTGHRAARQRILTMHANSRNPMDYLRAVFFPTLPFRVTLYAVA